MNQTQLVSPDNVALAASYVVAMFVGAVSLTIGIAIVIILTCIFNNRDRNELNKL